MIGSFWNYRKFIWDCAWRDLRHRYAGSSMGFLWNVIHPLFQILLYTIVFSQVMKVAIPSQSSTFGFAIYLCSGLVPWIGFHDTINSCTNSLVQNANYLKKLGIPEQVFVVQSAGSSLLSLVIGMVLLVCVCCVLGHYPAWCWCALPFILILFHGFAFGLGLFLGVMNIFFRDVSQILGMFIQIWFWMTPIVYMESTLPVFIKDGLYLNPAYHFIQAFHEIIVNKSLPNTTSIAVMLCLALSTPVLGFLVLRKSRSEIRDVL
jgi:lipopolysaccharide transport system permease protein